MILTHRKRHLVAIIPLHAWGPNAALRAAICAPGAASRPAAAHCEATHLRTRRESRGRSAQASPLFKNANGFRTGCSNTPNIKTRLDLRPWSLGSESLQHSKCPVLQQNNKLRPRTPHGVRRGHPGGRPEPTGRRLSALCGGWLPFVHDFDDSHLVALMAYPGRWVDLSLCSHAGLASFARTISALL